nr:MAG TPA: hypothetical protein [Caudoviricetes sp.]
MFPRGRVPELHRNSNYALHISATSRSAFRHLQHSEHLRSRFQAAAACSALRCSAAV